MSPFLRKSIATLKAEYPNDADYIDTEVQRYLTDDSPPDDSEFITLLKRRLEQKHPPPYTGKGLPKGRTPPLRRR